MSYDAYTAATIESLGAFIPELLVVATVLLVGLVDLIWVRGRAERHTWIETIVVVGLGAALIATIRTIPDEGRFLFSGTIVLDAFGHFFKMICLAAGLVLVLMTRWSDEIPKAERTEYYTLATGGMLGMMVMAAAADMIVVFLAVEFVSLTSYVLAGYRRDDVRSSEAALKYVLYGSVSSAVMVFGLSILYGLTGTTSLAAANLALYHSDPYGLALLGGLVLVLGGIGFKIACVPFHFWAPDVYEGSATPVTAFFTVAPKAAGVAVVIRFLVTLLTNPNTDPGFWTFVGNLDWPFLVAVISAVTMTLGNLGALRQDNMKRLLAYSSIAHVGFILMGVAVLSPEGVAAVCVYVAAYLVMNVGAFAVVIALTRKLGSVELPAYSGLAHRSPLLVVAMVIFLYSLTGLPPSIGFMGKYYVFAEVVRQGVYWLALVGAVNAVIALYYYFRVAKVMVFGALPDGAESGDLPCCATSFSLVIAAITLLLGLPWGIIEGVTHTAQLFIR